MKIIIIYDITNNNSEIIRKICNKYLTHIQYSVFEGVVTEATLKELTIKLNNAINKTQDSIIIYSINNPKWIDKKILGIEKNEITNFI